MGRSLLHIQRRTNHQIQTTRNNMSVSFKVTLSKGEEQETRRFQVDKEVAGSLVYLKQKIAAIFPELRRSEPVLSWVDEDGDEVVVTSDEELQVTLTALTGPVYKLKVKLGDKAKDGGHPGMARSAQVHWGVVCDGCDGPVVGPRHKCLVCPDYDLCATCEAQGLHVNHKMIRLPAPCKRVGPRCHLAGQVNPILGNPNIQVLANLFGGRPWVNGCQGIRPAMPATRNQAMPAGPKGTKPAEKKPETEKIPEAKKTECDEPSKPATTTEADHPTDQTSANANGLPGILADLTPLMGPLQAEPIAQFLRNISAPQQNQEPEKKEAKEKQPEQQLQEQLGQLGQLGGLISTFLGPAAVEAAFPLLEALTKAGQDHLAKDGQDGQEQPRKGDNQATEEQVPAQEKEAEEKEKKDVVPEKEKETETQDDIKEDSDFEVIPEASPKPSIYPTLPSEEQTRLWKTNPSQPENKDGKETAEKMDSNAHASGEDMKDNEKEDKVEAALKTMQAMGFSDDGGWLSNLLRAKSGDVQGL